MNKVLKIIAITLIALLSAFIIVLTTLFAITAGTNLQPEKLVDYSKTISVFDDQSNKIDDTSLETKKKSVKIGNLKSHTINAFIASEDRTFYRHNGLNYKRMLKAFYTNAVSRSFKQGASTISQQLIKNTHLNSDKTIIRKLKEIKLTRQLERRYSKDEILEMYLNTIYFGHNCFGLQNAAEFYFGCPAEELSLEQSATLVGLLTSPNNYSPFKNPQKSISKRNTVLKNMLDCNFIDSQTYDTTVNEPLSAKQDNSRSNGNSGFLNCVFEEFEELDIDPYGLNNQLKIMTYLNKDVQRSLENCQTQSDYSFIVTNNSGGVVGFRSTIGNVKRQIGSTAKPLFVYAPAIDQKALDLFTKINDEPINYGGYAPENYDKKYHGKVTVEECIMYSYNVPAVKTLNTLNMDQIEKFAKNMGVTLADDDKNLALALGGMSEGLTLKQLCDCYSTFANSGKYTPSRFIKEICDENGNVLYKNENVSNTVFSEGTCSLINDVLTKTAQSGTAKKLKDLNLDVACKTGTCGNKDGNTDAYSIAYTSEYCVGVWLGDRNNNRLDVTGGRDCCNITKEILSSAYTDKSCAPLDKTSGTQTIEIDREEYENNDKIMLCDDNSPKLNRLSVKCLTNNVPKAKSTKFTQPTIKKPTISVTNNNVCIVLCQTKYYLYSVKRANKNEKTEIYSGVWKEKICDAPTDGEYEYTVTPFYEKDGKKFYGQEIILPRVIIRSEKSDYKIPDIAYKDWYNQ